MKAPWTAIRELRETIAGLIVEQQEHLRVCEMTIQTQTRTLDDMVDAAQAMIDIYDLTGDHTLGHGPNSDCVRCHLEEKISSWQKVRR